MRALVILNTAVVGSTATAGCSIPATESIEVLAFPPNSVPVSLIVQTFSEASHSFSIAVTFGRRLVNVKAQSNESVHEASSDVLRKTTTVPYLL